MDGIHDMGGMHGFGAVGPEADEPVFHEPWEGRVVGLITVQDVQAISQGLWTWRTVADVMRPASPELFIQPEWSIMQAMELMVRTGFDRLVVMEGGRPVGLITGSAVARFLQLHKA